MTYGDKDNRQLRMAMLPQRGKAAYYVWALLCSCLAARCVSVSTRRGDGEWTPNRADCAARGLAVLTPEKLRDSIVLLNLRIGRRRRHDRYAGSGLIAAIFAPRARIL